MLKKRFFKTKDEVDVTFEYANADAEQVALVCDANDWTPVEMKKTKDGTFRAKIRLAKGGEFRFRYFVDEQYWANDEAADDYWPNEFGESNSVVRTFSDN